MALGDVYKKVGGSWTLQTNIRGATGATGATGPQGDTGDTGAAGADGADGADGTDGTTWFVQSSAPTANNTNDLWTDTDDGVVYYWNGSSWASTGINLTGPQGPTGDTGATGATGDTGPAGADGDDGADGADGATWYNGASATGGVDGDYYLIDA